MKNKNITDTKNHSIVLWSAFYSEANILLPSTNLVTVEENSKVQCENKLPEILLITSYPPRECGIATYSQDLIKALNNKFSASFSVKVCALQSGHLSYYYSDEVLWRLDTSIAHDYFEIGKNINDNTNIQVVLIQHEFGFYHEQQDAFLELLNMITKPIVIVFHTVLPNPDELLKEKIQLIAAACDSIIVMTNNSSHLLSWDYGVPDSKINVIAHGTHLVPHLGKRLLKKKYGLTGKKVLTTFGLLSSGKSIETTLDALPEIVKFKPDVLFLVIGKTHPDVLQREGEKYRNLLESKVEELELQNHVRFINRYLALPELLEYLQLTDIYLFTTNDPNQAVSGTFSYAMSCGCPIISTPIPHAREVLTKSTGIIVDFCDSLQLSQEVLHLLNNDPLRRNMSSNTLQKIVSTSWENSAIAHAMLLKQRAGEGIVIKYDLPTIKLDHLIKLTTEIGILQFSKISQPDIDSGYTIDDNARALIAMCMHFELTSEMSDLKYIQIYLDFIKYCQQPDGTFVNYVDKKREFTEQNNTNLEDANGRAVWALGYLISIKSKIPKNMIAYAESILLKTFSSFETIHSPRAIAFIIKGLYYYHSEINVEEILKLVNLLANRLLEMFKHESEINWEWYESYLTYANSIIPEAMLYAWSITKNIQYMETATNSFHFLLSKTFNENGIEVIPNKSWLKKGEEFGKYGEQPIDVAYTIMALSAFYNVFSEEEYYSKIVTAFNWFLGKNRLQQIVYNPCTGGCYDGLEEFHVNLNQGAESTLSYLLARFTIENYQSKIKETP